MVLGAAERLTVMFGGDFLALPVGAGGGGVVDLEAIHSDIPFATVGVTGDDAGESDEASGVLRPALQYGEVEEGEVVALDHFFAGAGGDGLGEKLSGFGEERKHLEFVEEALRGFEVHEDLDAVGEFIEGVHTQGQLHAGFRAELVDEDLRAGVVSYVLEEEGGAAGPSSFARPDSPFGSAQSRLGRLSPHVHLADAVGYLGDFQDGVDFSLDALEFAGAVEGGDPLAEVIEGQGGLQGTDDYKQLAVLGLARWAQVSATLVAEVPYRSGESVVR